MSQTPEGKSIVSLLESRAQTPIAVPPGAEFFSFTAQTRMSGIDLAGGHQIRKGAADAIAQFVKEQGGAVPAEFQPLVDGVASREAPRLHKDFGLTNGPVLRLRPFI